jgi:hypothetical protein
VCSEGGRVEADGGGMTMFGAHLISLQRATRLE